MKDQDKRTRRRTVSLSLREAALIDQARGGIPAASWLREAAIERFSRDLGIEAVDTARRAAPRRRNYAEREEQASVEVTPGTAPRRGRTGHVRSKDLANS